MSRLRGLLENSPSPIMIIDETGSLIEASSSAETIMKGFGTAGVGANPESAIPSTIREKVRQALRMPETADAVIRGVDVFDKSDGRKYFESRLFPINAPNQMHRLFGYIAVDVTERVSAELALKESEEKYSNYINFAPFGVFVVDEEGHYVDVNPSAGRITGYDRQQLLRMSIRDITASETMALAIRGFQDLKQSGSLNTELRYIHANGSIRWWTVNATRLSDGRYLGFSTDITDRKEAEEELIFLSSCDFLTGLYNRRYFELELKRADSEQYLPLSVIIGDINGVKLINDAFGHAEGDRLIIESANILKNCCRENDTLARIGGDEFGIILPNTDIAEALQMLAGMQAALKSFDASQKKRPVPAQRFPRVRNKKEPEGGHRANRQNCRRIYVSAQTARTQQFAQHHHFVHQGDDV